MAEIRNFLVCRHIRAERSAHLLVFKRGELARSGRGLALWFLPLSTSIAEVPVDDRELTFLFHARTADFQDVSAQGVLTYRVNAPETLAERIDFSIDLSEGGFKKEPLEQLAAMLTELAQQLAVAWIGKSPVREVLRHGQDAVRSAIAEGLVVDDALVAMGLEIVSVRVSAVRPTPDLEKALELPSRETIQQQADEATFQRRAMAVEKERAIQENELQNRIELSRREASLIEQHGLNERRRAEEAAAAQRISEESKAEGRRLETETTAERIRKVEEAKVEAERARMAVYRDMPTSVMAGLAARELAGKLQRIEHLNISPELLGPSLLKLIDVGTKRLGDEAAGGT
ncbi:MAG: band 7 protein [Myxococcales bacterium]|nr:band 7 protein [Myxococcales bacterium]